MKNQKNEFLGLMFNCKKWYNIRNLLSERVENQVYQEKLDLGIHI